MSFTDRAEAINKLENMDEFTVLLISLKSGSLGLNLTSASRAILLDPWWNPAVDEQAMGRIHRLGQTRQVKCVRTIARNTVEERIMKLQEKKRNLASGAMSENGVEGQRSNRLNVSVSFSFNKFNW